MLSVSKSIPGLSDSFNFKWADNYIENDVYSFYTHGDAAPTADFAIGIKE
ncbi:MAG: hypothetical protein IJC13_05230 [Clostridia bacterium]|nr:hypothetical protein [Clostridia bacterium]